MFAITAIATFETGEGRHSGDDSETPGIAPASTGCPGGRDRSERTKQIPCWFHGMRRWGWQVSRAGRLGEETFDGPLGHLPWSGWGKQQHAGDESAACPTGATDYTAPSAHSASSGRNPEDSGATIKRDLLHEREWHGSSIGPNEITKWRHRIGAPSGCKSDSCYVTSRISGANLASANSDPNSSENG